VKFPRFADPLAAGVRLFSARAKNRENVVDMLRGENSPHEESKLALDGRPKHPLPPFRFPDMLPVRPGNGRKIG